MEPSFAQVSEHASPAPPPPADAPREVTALVRRRAWTEPRVRLWWLLALGVLAVMLYVVSTQAVAWWKERRLLTHGVAVQAVILEARDRLQSISVPEKNMPPDSECTLQFTHKGKTYRVNGQLDEHMERGQHVTTDDPANPRHPVTLHIDPDDPERWTDRTTSPPLLKRVLVGMSIGLPIVALLALLAWLARRRAAEVWRSGAASTALVLSAGQTPVAPRARAVRCTPADSHDKRVFLVYLPAGVAPVAPGDVLWVVHPANKPDPVYSAAWFHREQA